MSNDLFPVRVVVIAMACVLVGSVAAITYLASTQTPIPDLLGQLAIGSLTGTSALLAKTSSTTTPQAVQVTNTATDPVPVDQLPEPDDIPTTGAPARKGS